MTIDPGARDPLPDLERYLRAVMRLRIETVRRMAAMAEHEPSLDLELARRAAERAIRKMRRGEVWSDVREALRRWALPNYPRGSVESDRLGGFVAAGISGVPYDPESPLRMTVLPLLMDAGACILVREQLEARDVEALLAGWRAGTAAVRGEGA
jgi:hypothetical protein